MAMQLNFTYDILPYLEQEFPEKPLFHIKRSGNWISINSNEFATRVRQLCHFLFSEGVKRGECVASIFSYNTYEWNVIDLALAQIGAIHVPVYPTISDSDYLFILNQAEVKRVFITDQTLYNKITHLQSELPNLQNIISIEKLPNVEDFDQVLDEQTSESEDFKQQLENAKSLNSVDDVCSIIYTSGTTGFPKGVMLTHNNLCSNTKAAVDVQPLGLGDKVLSFLPLCHIYERTAVYQFLIRGAEVYYAESLKSLLQNMREVKPQGTTLVPRVLEKILTGLHARAKKSNLAEKLIIFWSIRFGLKHKIEGENGQFYNWKLTLANRLVYRSVRAILGGKIKYVGCGGAPVNERILKFYWAAGIPVYEGYGLTECSPLVALNYPGPENVRLGTVGKTLHDVAVKIADDKEILVRGPNVLKGYFKNPELSKESFIDGWFCTGDLGEIVNEKYLKIIGRKKEMFKTSYGKYIVPQAIESHFLNSPIIDHLIIIGEGKHCAAAIISPNFEYCRALLPESFKGKNAKMIAQPVIKDAIRKEIARVNRQLGKTEQVKKFLVVEDSWTVESGELSATQKLKRNIIMKKYAVRIREMYHEDIISRL